MNTGFDFHSWFELGDPHVHFNAPPGKPYCESGEVGCPNWADLFTFVLDRCIGLADVQTVYVLVDDRDLSCEVTQDDSLRPLASSGSLVEESVGNARPDQ